MTYLIRCVLTFSKETFFEARKARINLGRPEMEKRKEKKRRREEKILVINVTRRSRSLDRESCWSELLPMLFGYLPIRWSHEAVTAESRTGKWEIGGRADRNHDGPSSINDPPPIHRSAITIFDVINPGSSLPCSQFCPWSCDLIWKGKRRERNERVVFLVIVPEKEREREKNISTSVYFQKYYYPFSRICISVNFFFSKKDSDDRR